MFERSRDATDGRITAIIDDDDLEPVGGIVLRGK
jgi:hypothetical protein